MPSLVKALALLAVAASSVIATPTETYPGNSGCAKYCQDNYEHCGFSNVGQCTSAAAKNDFKCICCKSGEVYLDDKKECGHPPAPPPTHECHWPLEYCHRLKKCTTKIACKILPEHPPRCPVYGESWCEIKKRCCKPVDCNPHCPVEGHKPCKAKGDRCMSDSECRAPVCGHEEEECRGKCVPKGHCLPTCPYACIPAVKH